MDITCKSCSSRFRAAVQTPLVAPVRVACPACGHQMALKPATIPGAPLPGNVVPLVDRRAPANNKRHAVVADEPRPFRTFLGDHLKRLGFDITYFDTGEAIVDFVRRTHAELAIVNVYLKGRLGVEVTEEIKGDAALRGTRVILIGALFRANRFRANPTNLYGADEYIEEQIPEREFNHIVSKLFPELGGLAEAAVEPVEYDEARRLARLILSDIVIYNAPKVERGIRENNFFDLLRDEIDEGRQYYESRVPLRVRRDSEIFTETLQQFVQMKREELERLRAGG